MCVRNGRFSHQSLVLLLSLLSESSPVSGTERRPVSTASGQVGWDVSSE